MLLASLLAPLFSYYSGGGHPEEHRVTAACEMCTSELNHSLGTAFTGCVMNKLLNEQAEALAKGKDDFFPTVPHVLDPLSPVKTADIPKDLLPGRGTAELLRNLLRNHSCDVEDGGSQPVRSMTWEYIPSDPCKDHDATKPPFTYKIGFLPGGNDLPETWSGSKWIKSSSTTQPKLTVEEAQSACLKHKACSGFTYSSPARDETKRHVIYFKTMADGVSIADNWHTFKRSRTDCRPGFRPPPPSTQRYQVDVLRESPPVYVIRDFVSEPECDHMLGITIPNMERSVVFGGGQAGQASNYRQSYSVNMYPDYDDEANVVTRVVRRKFAFAREVADYEELVEGEGQEPLNSVFYKDWDDQYRPHCDGECHGGPYRHGSRIATSLTYCEVADKGGYTLFTRSNLKVVPRLRDMLFFGYKIQEEGSSPRMDPGYTEHSGCPLRKGRKWIATM